MTNPGASLRSPSESTFALRFFATTCGVFCFAVVLAEVLIRFVSYGTTPAGRLVMPPAFAGSTVALLAASVSLHRALRHVRTERQQPFRRELLAALASGSLFAGIQVYGLWCLLKNLSGDEGATAADGFVFVFATLHGLHCIVALLFLIFVVLRALADRYDHEYYWGVMVCAFFWHGLAAVWLCIIAVFAIATLAGSPPRVIPVDGVSVTQHTTKRNSNPNQARPHQGPITGSGSGTLSITCRSTSICASSAMLVFR